MKTIFVSNIQFFRYFSGKEKDEETSYSYFGARYYMSDVSIWLSVDPLWEKFPNISPFNYCHWNPVMLTDPDGMDDTDFGVTSSGEIRQIGPTNNEPDRLFAINNDNSRKDVNNDGKMANGTDFIKFDSKNIKTISAVKVLTVGGDGAIEGERYGSKTLVSDSKTAKQLFEFFADNTNVEMSKQKLTKGKESMFLLFTSRSEGTVSGGSVISQEYTDAGWSIAEDTHNHPKGDIKPSNYIGDGGRRGDIPYKNNILNEFPNAKFSIYTSQSKKYSNSASKYLILFLAACSSVGTTASAGEFSPTF